MRLLLWCSYSWWYCKRIYGRRNSKKIARELTTAIRNNITIDWSVRKGARAGMRRIVKRLLRKYKYPPEQAKKALVIVMKQAEKMCSNQIDFLSHKRASEGDRLYEVEEEEW